MSIAPIITFKAGICDLDVSTPSSLSVCLSSGSCLTDLSQPHVNAI